MTQTGHRRFWIYLFLLSLSTINYADRMALSVAAKDVAREFTLSPGQIGVLFSSFLWFYIVCLVPMGTIVDRIGAKSTNAVGIALWSLATVATGFSAGLGTLIACRALMGAGESTTFPAGAKVIRQWAPASERGIATGIFYSGLCLGPAAGAIAVGWLTSLYGWRTAFFVVGSLGLIWLIAWMRWYQSPERSAWLGETERNLVVSQRETGTDAAPPPSRFRDLLRAPTIWALVVANGCAAYAAYFLISWMPGYLQTARGLTILKSGVYTAIPFICAAVLTPIIGRLSDAALNSATQRQGRRRLAVFLTMALSATILVTPSVSSIAMVVVVFTLGITGVFSCGSLLIALVIDLTRSPGNLGKSVSIVMAGGNLLGMLGPIVTGYVIGRSGSYDGAFLIAGCLLIIGSLVVLLLSRWPIIAARDA